MSFDPTPLSAVLTDPDRDLLPGGWLLVLCFFLAIWQPVNLALAASSALAALPVRGVPLAALLAVRVISTACGIAAAIAIYRRHPGAVTVVKISLTLSAGLDLFVYTTSYFPNNRLPGDTILYIAWSLAFYGGWLLYVFNSARVRRTLGDDGRSADASSDGLTPSNRRAPKL